jgi:hypothetical protein
MPSKTFIAIAEAEKADEAFTKAVNGAKEEFGDGGKTGTIADKKSFVILQDEPFPTNEAVRNAVYGILELGDEELEKPGAPAGCFPFKFLGRGQFMFFGWTQV